MAGWGRRIERTTLTQASLPREAFGVREACFRFGHQIRKRKQASRTPNASRGSIPSCHLFECLPNSPIKPSITCKEAAPVSPSTVALAAPGSGDFTYGGNFKTPIGMVAVQSYGTVVNNSEIMAVLLDLEKFGNGNTTINVGHTRNPHRTPFLNATMSGDTSSPGVGIDGVYRDPWGNPFIITIDL